METEDGAEASVVRPRPTVVAKSSQKPPPEKHTSIKNRSFVIASFWLVVLLLGFPVWVWTTSIHRAHLPLDEMLDWAKGKACKPSFPLHITIEALYMKEAEAVNFVRMTQHALDDLSEFSIHHLRLRLSPKRKEDESALTSEATDSSHSQNPDEALIVRLEADNKISAIYSEPPRHSKVLRIFYPSNQTPSTSSSSSLLSNYLASQLEEVYVEERAILEHVLTSGLPPFGQQAQSSNTASRELRNRQRRLPNPELSGKLATRMDRSLKYAPTYHITISLFTPTAQPSAWDIEAAIADYFAPLLKLLSPVSTFTVETQIQLHAQFAPSVHLPEFDEQQNFWTLREEDISAFINAAEWPLSPSLGAGPTLNFILYVPDAKSSPLFVRGSHATNWLIPQWGGIAILNPSNGSQELPPKLPKETLQPALLTFSHQLLSFFGVPQSPSSLPLQLQTLTRVRAASLLLSASSTMGSLANLTVALPSIAIPETVSFAVDITLSHLRQACSDLKAGKFVKALEHARVAEEQAEKGFFEKSMVGQVYFPDEHKVAVYLPLLGPIGVPLVMSALKEVKRIVAVYRERKYGR